MLKNTVDIHRREGTMEQSKLIPMNHNHEMEQLDICKQYITGNSASFHSQYWSRTYSAFLL
jgi:hypothetical protein